MGAEEGAGARTLLAWKRSESVRFSRMQKCPARTTTLVHGTSRNKWRFAGRGAARAESREEFWRRTQVHEGGGELVEQEEAGAVVDEGARVAADRVGDQARHRVHREPGVPPFRDADVQVPCANPSRRQRRSVGRGRSEGGAGGRAAHR